MDKYSSPKNSKSIKGISYADPDKSRNNGSAHPNGLSTKPTRLSRLHEKESIALTKFDLVKSEGVIYKKTKQGSQHNLVDQK